MIKVAVIPTITHDIELLIAHKVLQLLESRTCWFWTSTYVIKFNKDQ